ncbi:MAG: alpha/beta fold hydrolase [Gemmatimonadota bacterium]
MRTRPRAMVAALAVLLLPTSLVAQEGWVGSWQGSLQVGPQSLPLVIHVTRGSDGLEATMDSPAQGSTGIPVSAVRTSADSLILEVQVIQGRFRGERQADGRIAGTWSQGSNSLPLVLERVPEGEEPRGAPDPADRPQTPRCPCPYDSQEVRFPNPAGGFELAGTLTLPRGPGPFPGVVLVSGSGPQDRDETLLGHKPFAVLADHLTRRGIAVLRYDDRGVGGSAGEFASATSEDFATDAEAALAWLGARPEVRADAVGIVGHSEGGLVAPLLAARSERPRFLVLLAGPGVTGLDVLRTQSRDIAQLQGAAPAALEMNDRVLVRLHGIMRETRDSAEAASRMRAALEEEVGRLTPAERAAAGVPEDPDAWLDAQVNQFNTPWMRYFLDHDPGPELEATRVPVLALNGSLDTQVDADINLRAIEEALERGGNPDYTVEELEGLNHLFQEAGTGNPAEYAGIDQTMSPQAMDRVASWILERFGG